MQVKYLRIESNFSRWDLDVPVARNRKMNDEQRGAELADSAAVFEVVVKCTIRKPLDEPRRLLIGALWMKGAVGNRPIIGTFIERVTGKKTAQAMFRNPVLGTLQRGKDAGRELCACAVKNPNCVHKL